MKTAQAVKGEEQRLQLLCLTCTPAPASALRSGVCCVSAWHPLPDC
jgi:hypothetical protein